MRHISASRSEEHTSELQSLTNLARPPLAPSPLPLHAALPISDTLHPAIHGHDSCRQRARRRGALARRITARLRGRTTTSDLREIAGSVRSRAHLEDGECDISLLLDRKSTRLNSSH